MEKRKPGKPDSGQDVDSPYEQQELHSAEDMHPFALGVANPHTSGESPFASVFKPMQGTKPSNQASRLRSMSTASVSMAENLYEEGDSAFERHLVGSLTKSYPFAKGGLCKKTISIQIEDSTQHLIAYYTLDDVRSGRLRTPSSLPEIASLSISPIFLTKTSFRCPPTVVIGPDGTPRFQSDESHESAHRRSELESSGEATSSGSDSALRRARSSKVRESKQKPGSRSRGDESSLSTSQSMSSLGAHPDTTVDRSAPAPNEIGGSGALPRDRRSSDAALKTSRSRFGPYKKNSVSGFTHGGAAQVKGGQSGSSLSTSPSSTPSTPYFQHGGFFNTFQMPVEGAGMAAHLPQRHTVPSWTDSTHMMQQQSSLAPLGSFGMAGADLSANRDSHLGDNSFTPMMAQRPFTAQPHRAVPQHDVPTAAQSFHRMGRPLSDHGRLHLDSSQENLRRAIESSGWDPIPPSSYQGSVAGQTVPVSHADVGLPLFQEAKEQGATLGAAAAPFGVEKDVSQGQWNTMPEASVGLGAFMPQMDNVQHPTMDWCGGARNEQALLEQLGSGSLPNYPPLHSDASMFSMAQPPHTPLHASGMSNEDSELYRQAASGLPGMLPNTSVHHSVSSPKGSKNGRRRPSSKSFLRSHQESMMPP